MMNWRQKDTPATSPKLSSQDSGAASVSLRGQTSTIPVGDELGTSEGLVVGAELGEELEVGVALGTGLEVGVALGAKNVVGAKLMDGWKLRLGLVLGDTDGRADTDGREEGVIDGIILVDGA